MITLIIQKKYWILLKLPSPSNLLFCTSLLKMGDLNDILEMTMGHISDLCRE